MNREATMTSNHQESPTGWSFLREKILPTIMTAAMIGTFVTGFAMWKELAVISVKLDNLTGVISDHEARLRMLEKEKSRP